jgi:uncharacterized protein (TIGR03437 family)
LWLVAASTGLLSWAGTSAREAPSYSAAGIVNAAANVPGLLAPNTIASLYGTNLSRGTASVDTSSILNGFLPTTLAGTGTRVFVRGQPAFLFYVSPKQINFLVPSTSRPGSADIWVTLDGFAGPSVRVVLVDAGPALFTYGDPPTAIATRVDGSLVTKDAPLQPGEYAVLYATGLGDTEPPAESGRLVTAAAQVADRDSLELSLGGTPLGRSNLEYAGLTPGSAGLYQLNIRMPSGLPDDPEIRITLKQRSSPSGIRLPFRSSGSTSSQRD